jgi:hypothetical protein
MPRPLVTQQYPDDFQVLSFSASPPLSGTPLLYADRDIAIDSIVIGNAAASSGDAVQLTKTTTGTSTTPASISVAVIEAGTALQTLTNTNTDNNIVKAGNWVGLVLTGATGSSVVGIRIRYRSCIA